MKAFFISIPHSGEKIPPEAPWLNGLPETLLMFDVDRYVDRLYQPTMDALDIPSVLTEWHRYAIDLNRLKDDVDVDSVIGSPNPSGKFPRGLHWAITTKREKLMPKPITMEVHNILVQKYFEPFHEQVRTQFADFKKQGARTVFHIDAHSMPSVGTSEHLDPGERRADIVVSDVAGKSCGADFKDLVIQSYEVAGFKVAYNWPYKGGRVTETYGKPDLGQETIQVEMNRALYMDETTKALRQDLYPEVQRKIRVAIERILALLPDRGRVKVGGITGH